MRGTAHPARAGRPRSPGCRRTAPGRGAGGGRPGPRPPPALRARAQRASFVPVEASEGLLRSVRGAAVVEKRLLHVDPEGEARSDTRQERDRLRVVADDAAPGGTRVDAAVLRSQRLAEAVPLQRARDAVTDRRVVAHRIV